MTNEYEIIKDFTSALIGDETAWIEINAAMSAHFKDGRHVTWNSDWVNKVASLSSPEREAEIQKGIDNLVEIDAMLARGEYTEATFVGDSRDPEMLRKYKEAGFQSPDPEIQKLIDAVQI